MITPGEWIAEQWMPSDLIFNEWVDFINLSIFVLPLLATACSFLAYRFFAYKLIRVESWNAIYDLRYPWFWGLASVPVINVIFTLTCFYFALSQSNLGALLQAILLSLIGGGAGMLIYWVLSFLSYPARGKYFSPLKWRG